MTIVNIEDELYKGISSNTKASSLALLLNIIVIDIAFYEYIPLLTLFLWTLSLSILLLIRNIDTYKYMHKTTKRTIQQLALRFKILSFLVAILVSAGIFYITPSNLPFHQAFLAMIVAGLSAGTVMALSYYQTLLRIYLIILVIPFAFLILLQGGKIHILISFLMFIFLLMLIMFSKRYFNNLVDLIQSKNEIYLQAHYDHITGLLNRSAFYNRLNLELAKLKRTSQYSVLLFIDLDDFKHINDSYGHHIGDKTLKLFAQKISSIIREEDSFARLGGDEFVILLSQLEREHTKTIEIANYIAKKIHKKLQQPFSIEQQLLPLSISIGIEIIQPKNNDILEIIKNADIAMYKAKKQGKNQTVVF